MRSFPAALLLPLLLSSPLQADEPSEVAAYQDENFALIEKAAGRGDPAAQYRLGSLYLVGKAVEQDDAKAALWLAKSAKQGYAPAQNRLGALYLGGYAVARNESEALRWFSKAAGQGLAEAQRNLAALYASGAGLDLGASRRWYEKAAAQGDAESQYQLGRFDQEGRAGKPDRAGAKSWFAKAAAGGHAGAQLALADLLAAGGDDAGALTWLKRAADLSHVPAQARLAEVYEEGRGTPKDPAEAWRLWQEAAAGGVPRAQVRAGQAYQLGLFGLDLDPARAAKWYRRAAEQGEPRAAYALARLIRAGDAKSLDAGEAGLWIQKAALQGLPEAQHDLGLMYQNGSDGVNADRVKACAWLSLAAEQGDLEDRASLDALKSSLNGEELGRVVEEMGRDRASKPARPARP